MFIWPICSAAKIVLLMSFVARPEISLAQQKATIFGTATANLRSGPGVEHALIAVLKEGDRVGVEQLTGDWYSVSIADGQKGYVHKNLLKLAAESTTQPSAVSPSPPAAVPLKTNPAAAKESAKETIPGAAAPAAVAAPSEQPTKVTPPPPAPMPKIEPPKPVDAKSQSVLQMLEGHETEAKIGLIIAAICFAIGWLCGGAYYTRRERRSRHKLRF